MGGVREGEKTSHHALQDRPNRFPCGELGIRIRRWLAALACGSKRHPSLSPPNPGWSRAEDLGSAPSQLWSGGIAQVCEEAVWRFERPVLKALLYAEELEIRAFLRSALPTQYLLCCNTHCLFLWHWSTGACLVLARDIYKVSPTKCFPWVTPLPTGKWLSQTQQGLNCLISSMVGEKRGKKETNEQNQASRSR